MINLLKYWTDGAGAPQPGKENPILSPWDHFDGMGTGESVPPYLRCTNRVQNLFLSCADTVSFVREIAGAKHSAGKVLPLLVAPSNLRHREEVEPDKAPYAEYFEVYLKVSQNNLRSNH